MIEFDPSELDSWASTASANVQFPRLIRKLILATVPTPSPAEYAERQFGVVGRMGRLAQSGQWKLLGA